MVAWKTIDPKLFGYQQKEYQPSSEKYQLKWHDLNSNCAPRLNISFAFVRCRSDFGMKWRFSLSFKAIRMLHFAGKILLFFRMNKYFILRIVSHTKSSAIKRCSMLCLSALERIDFEKLWIRFGCLSWNFSIISGLPTIWRRTVYKLQTLGKNNKVCVVQVLFSMYVNKLYYVIHCSYRAT